MRSRASAAIAVLFLANVLNFYDRLILGAVLEPVRREFGLSDMQSGALVTLFTLVFAFAGLPAGRLADTRSRRRLLAFGMLLWAGLTGMGALAASYGMLLATRLGVGLGEAICAPAATSWLADRVEAKRRSRAMALFMMAVPVGGLISYSIGGPLAQAYGWRAAMAGAALPALLLIPALLWLEEPARAERKQEEAAPWKAPRVFWWIAASGAAINFALYAFSTFLPAMLTRYHGLSVAQAGVWVGLGTGISGITGALAAGALGDRVRRKLRFTAVLMLAAAVPMFLALGMRPGAATAAVVLAMLAYGLMQMYYGLVYGAIADIAPAHARGRAMSVYLMVTYVGGASWGPVATGRLSDWLARSSGRAAGLHDALYVVPVTAVVLAWMLWEADRRWTRAAD